MSSTSTKPSLKRVVPPKGRPKRATAPHKRPFSLVATHGDIHEYLYAKNGLRVLFMRIVGSGSATVNIVYEVGSRHEARGETGIAHMLEHMMFKDTVDRNGKRVAPPRYKELEAKGALLNATTWIDRTNYYFTMPSAYLSDMLRAEAERMRGLILTPKEFKPEQQNVLSEYEMYNERPGHLLERALVEQAFVSHGYGHETIGHKSDIASFTCDDLKRFYDAHYWPDNAYLVVVGDVALADTLKAIEKHFGHISRRTKTLPTTPSVEPPQDGVRTVEIRRPNPLTLIALAYRAPRAVERDWAVARVLLSYLTEGKLSPLYKKLIETHKASSVAPQLLLSHDPHLMEITATVSAGSTPAEVQRIMQKEIELLKTKKLRAKDLARVKNKIIASELYGRDGTHTIAQELTEYIAAGDWRRYYTLLKDIESVTEGDIMRVAKAYFRDDALTMGTFIGTKETAHART